MEVFYIGLGPFKGSGNVSCASGRCSLLCAGGNPCVTDPPSTGNKAPFGPAFTFDAAIDAVETARGFSLDFHLISRNDSGPNGATEGVDWGGNLTLEVYAPLAAGQEVAGRTAYSLSADWTNAEKGAKVSVGFLERCDAGGRGISSPGSGTSSKSLAGNIDCVLAVDGSKTIETAEGTFRLVQRLSFAMSAGLRFNDGMRSAGNGHIEFSFKPKGKELKAISGPVEGLAGADPSFPQPFVVKVFQNDTGAAVAGERVTFQLKSLAGAAVGPTPTAAADTLGDGTAAVNFKVAVPGDYKLEATCAGCVEGSPLFFTTKILSLNQAAELRKHSASNGGIVGERLRNPLMVKVINRVTGKPIKEQSIEVNFELLPEPPCPAVTSIDAKVTSTLGEAATAQTHVTLGALPGNCKVRAHCAQCLAQPEVLFDFAIKPRPEFQNDGGSPGNPFSRGGGGPSTTGGRRQPGQFMIEYKLDPFGGFHLTRPPAVGFIGALTGDTLNYRVTPTAGVFAWSDTSGGGTGSGPSLDVSYTAVNDDPGKPTVQSALRQDDLREERVRVLVFKRPSGLAVTAGKPGEIAAHALLGKRCLKEVEKPELCPLLLLAHYTAYRWAERNFEPRGRVGGTCDHNCCDVGKHAYWHATAVFIANEDIANEFGIEHEGRAIHDGRPHNEIAMDLHSNALGRSIARDLLAFGRPKEEIEDRLKGAILRGEGLVFYGTDDKLSLLVASSHCGN